MTEPVPVCLEKWKSASRENKRGDDGTRITKASVLACFLYDLTHCRIARSRICAIVTSPCLGRDGDGARAVQFGRVEERVEWRENKRRRGGACTSSRLPLQAAFAITIWVIGKPCSWISHFTSEVGARR